MTGDSLRLRLLLGGAAAIILALLIAGAGLQYLFERHVSRRVEAELRDHLRGLAASVAIDKAGTVTVPKPPFDAHFEVPFSGLYWQLNDEDGQVLRRSVSLWDVAIALPRDLIADGAVHMHRLAGPGGGMLLVAERRLGLVTSAETRKWLRLVAAADQRVVTEAVAAFRSDLVPALSLLALVLIGAGWFQVSVGLRPLRQVGEMVAAVRSGKVRRLGGELPDEVGPLVKEINGLLDVNDDTIAKSRRRAADLAHGLKTPLTALAGDAERLRQRGQPEIADDLDELIEVMRRHIDRELARVRIRLSHGGQAAVNIRAAVEPVIRTLKRTPTGQALTFALDGADTASLAVDPADLTELLGNLLENAARHARTRIEVSVDNAPAGDRQILRISDDGPGIPQHLRENALSAGARLDQTGAGSGLGLAIVSDIVEAYDGSLSLSTAAIGGLLVEIEFPAAEHRRSASSDPARS